MHPPQKAGQDARKAGLLLDFSGGGVGRRLAVVEFSFRQ
jgi:hypothetical protein